MSHQICGASSPCLEAGGGSAAPPFVGETFRCRRWAIEWPHATYNHGGMGRGARGVSLWSRGKTSEGLVPKGHRSVKQEAPRAREGIPRLQAWGECQVLYIP